MAGPTPMEEYTDALAFALVAVEALNLSVIPDMTVLLAPDALALGHLLAQLRRSVKYLQDCAALVEDEMVKCAPSKQFEVPGVGTAEIHTGSKRTSWNHDEVAGVVAHALADEIPAMVTEDGEPVNHIQYVTDIINGFRVASSDGWKVTGLRALKIDPDDYCHTEWGRKTVQMPALGRDDG